MTASGIALAPSRAGSDERRGIAAIGSPRLRSIGGLVGFALLVYVPMLLTHPGRVVADTKSYPYLDPDRFIGRIGSLWDPNIGLGTVTHQNIGYLFPFGPFYWVTHGVLGMPAWVAQRLWFGTLLFAAGMGVRYLLRTLDVRGPGVPVAMLVYALSPYATEFSARLSVLLGPWAALGFFLGFTIRALRNVRGWKYPALIAITVQIVGGVNATALLYALIAPALWVPYAIWVRREITWRDAWSAIWRTALLTGLTSLWWAVGLVIEGSYGMGILRFTESVAVVSHTSTATEVIRGLGYWFFYGGDVSGPWNDGVLDFTRRNVVIFVSFAIPGLAMLAAGFLRWTHRAFFIGLVIIGMVIAVAASPYDDPTVLGSLFKAFATSSTAGFALRSTARAVPMLVLGLAVLLGLGISAWWEAMAARGRQWIVVGAAVVVGVMCVVNAPGLWRGRYYSRYLERDEEVPTYWQQALHSLDAKGGDTRVLGLPGADFAAYRWGDTIDPIEPGLMDPPYIARELVPWGGEATTNLLIALDRRVQDRLLDPNALAPIARLMGVGDILLRLDLQTDQFSLVSARGLWEDFTKHGTPRGLGPPTTYGTKTPGKLIGTDIGDPAEPPTPEPKPVAIFPVSEPQSIIRAHPAAGPLVIDGDGEGLVDAAGVGLLPDTRLIVPSAEYVASPKQLRAHVPPDAVLLVTDTNRRQGMRWQGMRNNYGYTEQAGEQPLRDDLLDQRLEIYPGATDRARTVVELRGLRSVRATTYGTPAFGFTPSARPANAFDGDARSAWEVASGETKVGKERLVAELEEPVTTDHVLLQQAAHGARGRWITRVGVRLDGGPEHVYAIARRGKTRVDFPRQRFSKFEIQILATDANKVQAVATEAGRRRKTGVGFEEIEIKDDVRGSHTVRVHEVTRLPQDLLGSLGARSASHPLALLMTTPADTGTWRRFVLPTARSFSVSGTAHLNNAAKDSAIDAALGTTCFTRSTPMA
jgi:arabinofuranan 3-O-arabinosyltransferase